MKCNIKYNRMQYLIELKWKQRKKQLPFTELGSEYTLPLVWISIPPLESSWVFNVANEGQSSSIVYITVLPLNTKLTIIC